MKIFSISLLFFANAVFSAETKYFSPENVAANIKEKPEAQAADRAAEAAASGSPEIKKELYGIAEGVMPWIIETTAGDETKMKNILEEAKANPEAFLKRLPAHIRDQVTAVSRQIEIQRAPKPVP